MVDQSRDGSTEMVRMLQPGRLLSLIDTDWSTFNIDIGDSELCRQVREAMQIERRRPSNIGRRLGELAEGLGLALISHTSAILNLVDAGKLDVENQERFVPPFTRPRVKAAWR